LKKGVELEKQEKTTWLQARLTEITAAIQEEIISTSPGLQAKEILEWWKLVGGSEETDFESACKNYCARRAIGNKIIIALN
jgi:hypothetical protein